MLILNPGTLEEYSKTKYIFKLFVTLTWFRITSAIPCFESKYTYTLYQHFLFSMEQKGEQNIFTFSNNLSLVFASVDAEVDIPLIRWGKYKLTDSTAFEMTSSFALFCIKEKDLLLSLKPDSMARLCVWYRHWKLISLFTYIFKFAGFIWI